MITILIVVSLFLSGDTVQTKNPPKPTIEGLIGDDTPQKAMFPEWLFGDPQGENALTTVTSVNGRELTRQVQYLKRFSPVACNYTGKTSRMMVARTQADFDRIMKLVGDIETPRKLNFDKELFIFAFAGTKGANFRTVVEVAEIDRSSGPLLTNEVYDACVVRVHIDHLSVGEQKGYSPWTMIRVNKETFFKEHPQTADTKFVMIESRSFIRVTNEEPASK